MRYAFFFFLLVLFNILLPKHFTLQSRFSSYTLFKFSARFFLHFLPRFLSGVLISTNTEKLYKTLMKQPFCLQTCSRLLRPPFLQKLPSTKPKVKKSVKNPQKLFKALLKPSSSSLKQRKLCETVHKPFRD